MPLEISFTYLALALFGLASLCVLQPRLASSIWLFAFPITAVLQAPAAMIVQHQGSKIGISPFQLWGALAYVVLTVHIYREVRRSPQPTARALLQELIKDRKTAGLILGYFLYAILTALTLPFLFEGLPLHLLGRIEGDTIPPEPLRFNLGHIAQIVNTFCLIALALLVLLDKRAFIMLVGGTITSYVVSFTANIAQRLTVLGTITHRAEFYPLNPSYNQHFGPTSPMQDPWLERVSLPFIEPSYATPWFAAITVAGWLLAAGIISNLSDRMSIVGHNPAIRPQSPSSSRREYSRILLITLTLIASVLTTLLGLTTMLNTRGTTGLVALVVAVPLILGMLAIIGRWRLTIISLCILIIAGLALGAIGTRIISPIQLSHVQQAIESSKQKTQEYLFLNTHPDEVGRIASNNKAIDLFRSTYGLGVGLGSHRPSGYFHALLANLGVFGTLGFFALISWPFWRLLGRLRCNAPAGSIIVDLVLLGFFVTMFIAVAGGIPDLNWPIWWLSIMLLIARVTHSNNPC